MNDKVIIYGLFDPRNGECFYVGKTGQEINVRLTQHIKETGYNSHKDRKIKKIINSGRNPEIRELYSFKNYTCKGLIKEGGYNNWWEYVERYYINYYKNILNQPLTNLTEGGDGENSYLKKSVFQFNSHGILINKFNSLFEASELTGVGFPTISLCCHQKRKSGGGFQWSFEENPHYIQTYSHKKGVIQFDLNGKYLNEFISGREAGRQTGVDARNICQCCKGTFKSAGGFKWEYNN